MSRSGSITLDWADGTYPFALKWRQLMELQEKCDAGVNVVLNRLMDGTWRVEDVIEPIRLGLIGGGLAPADALKLVRRYVEERPPLENIFVATAIVHAGVAGAPDEEVGKGEAGASELTRSREESSASPPSSEPPPPPE